MTDLEAQEHLRDCLFYGVRKHICDSIWYLYSTPGISYSQFMIATQKVESENELTWDQVRKMAMVTTMEGMAELKHQSAQLMAGQMTQACSLPTGHVGEDIGRRNTEQVNWGPSVRGEGAASCREPLSLQCYRCQGWGHMARVPYTGINFKPAWGNWRNMAHQLVGNSHPRQQ